MSGRSPRLISVKRVTPLGTIEIGTLVKLNENGSPIEFYVAKHDYEAELNGSGRTLLVRKECADNVAFGTNNAYAGGTLDVFLNETFFQRLDADVRSKIALTKFYYTPGAGNTTMTTLERKVFQLSTTELGLSLGYVNAEGTALAIASTLRVPNHAQWTRTPYSYNSTYAISLTYSGSTKYNSSVSSYYGSRPSFTLPATTKISDDLLIA